MRYEVIRVRRSIIQEDISLRREVDEDELWETILDMIAFLDKETDHIEIWPIIEEQE